MVVRTPVIERVVFEVIEIYDEAVGMVEDIATLTVGPPDGQAEDIRPLARVLLAGEPTDMHFVRRTFDPPWVLRVNDRPVFLLGGVTARVGEIEKPPVDVTIGGMETVAWMIRDALSGVRLWLAHDGRVWTTAS
jgi:hypothetical protein